jgi:hypothetical protein
MYTRGSGGCKTVRIERKPYNVNADTFCALHIQKRFFGVCGKRNRPRRGRLKPLRKIDAFQRRRRVAQCNGRKVKIPRRIRAYGGFTVGITGIAGSLSGTARRKRRGCN